MENLPYKSGNKHLNAALKEWCNEKWAYPSFLAHALDLWDRSPLLNPLLKLANRSIHDGCSNNCTAEWV